MSTTLQDSSNLEAEIPGFATVPPTLITDPPMTDPSPSSDTNKSPSSATPTGGSSPASTAESRRTLEGILGGAFDLTGLYLHDRFTPQDPGDCWIPRPEERDMVAGSIASIAARHMPVGTGPATDLSDGITAGVGLLLYAMNNAMRTRQLERTAPTPVPGGAAPTVAFNDQPAPAPAAPDGGLPGSALPDVALAMG